MLSGRMQGRYGYKIQVFQSISRIHIFRRKHASRNIQYREGDFGIRPKTTSRILSRRRSGESAKVCPNRLDKRQGLPESFG